MHNRIALASFLLMALLGEGLAQSLGGLQGRAVLGRPLDVSVPARFNADADQVGQCVQADVRYGDTPLASSDVQVDVQGSGETVRLQVRTRVPVDEPVVTLELRLGCPPRFARTFTLLSDIDHQAAQAPAAAVAGVSNAAAASNAPVQPAPERRRSETKKANAPASSSGHVAATVSPLPDPARAASTRRVAEVPVSVSWLDRLHWEFSAPGSEAAGTAGGDVDRLKLDMVDWARELGVDLTHVFGEGNSPIHKQLELVQAQLQELQQRNSALVAELEAARLAEQAEREEKTAWMAGAASAVALMLAVILWARRRIAERGLRSSPIWSAAASDDARNQVAAEAPLQTLAALPQGSRWLARMRTLWPRRAHGASAPVGEPADTGASAASTVIEARSEPVGVAQVAVPPKADRVTKASGGVSSDASLTRDGAGQTSLAPTPPLADAGLAQEASATTPVEAGDPLTSSPSVPADDEASVAFSAAVAALREAWSEADFCEAFDQTDQAIEALRRFIVEHPGASEAPYLRWLNVAQRHGRDTQGVYALYEQHFQWPLSDSLADSRTDLESDSDILALLQQEWPRAQARFRVQQAILSKPWDIDSPLRVRTLPAFDDLLCLDSILEERLATS